MDHLQQITNATKGDELITIETTEPIEQYKVSKGVLCEVSTYFVKALEGEFKEASERKLNLPGSSANTVKIFIYWLHQRKVPAFADELKDCTAGSTPCDKNKAVTERHMMLADLYVLGDQLFCKSLQACVLREILAIMGRFFTPKEAIAYAYPLCPETNLRAAYVIQAQHEYFHTTNLMPEELDELLQMAGFGLDFMDGVYDAVGKSGCRLESAREHGFDERED